MNFQTSLFRMVAVAATGIALGAPDQATAGSAPAAALNKTIRISFGVSGTVIRPGEGERNYSTLASYVIYVSSAGRLFTRHVATAAGRRNGRMRETQIGPGGTNRASFNFSGNTLVGQIAYASGARLVNATFDPGFTSCTANIRDGRENGASIRRRGPAGSMNQVLSSTISSPSCAIEQGNAFAGG